MLSPAVTRCLLAGVGIFVGLTLAGFEYLSLNDFCYKERRFLSDRELIDAAIRLQIGYIRDHERARGTHVYASVQQLHELNPTCCSLERRGDPFLRAYGPWEYHMRLLRRRLLGQELFVVNLWYRLRDDGPKPFWRSHFLVDACGARGSKISGYPTADVPRRSWGGLTFD